jgi:glutaconate CoA-transferase, subunit A
MTTPADATPWVGDFDARDRVPDGSLIAVGGIGTSRKPMALIRAIADAGVRDLRVISVLGSVDVEYLLAAGCLAEVHTAGVAIDGIGMAPLYRQARQSGNVRVVEWSEGSLHAALDASARGVPSLACSTSPGSDVVAGNDNLVVSPDPFTGAPVVHARAMTPDVALLHVAQASPRGDLFIDGDAAFDVVTACASNYVVVSVEQVAEREGCEASLSRIWVDALIHSPGGAWPTACFPLASVDAGALQKWVSSKGDLAVLAAHPARRVHAGRN